MKAVAVILLASFLPAKVWACEVCESNQPEVLKNVTHGPGPQSDWDFVIIWSAVAIVALTLYLSLKYLLRPNEQSGSHIKNIVVENA